MLRWEKFPGFREAFDPADINWGQDPAPFVQRIADIKQGVCLVRLWTFYYPQGFLPTPPSKAGVFYASDVR